MRTNAPRTLLLLLALLLLQGLLGARPAAAQCVNGAACDDFSVCTTNDTCVDGVCIGTAVVCGDDGNACTTASCHPTLGCQQLNNTAPCEDGDLCTLNDVCSAGSCRAGPPKSCGDGNACTDDLCAPATGLCSNPPNTAPCSDGNACTTGDVCAAGSCQPGAGQLACGDGNTCTTDACNPAIGCTHTNVANGTGCNDGSICTTGDRCASGLCVGNAVTCPDDGNACTTATCHPTLGCGQLNNTLPCDDANGCTVSDVCGGGSCQPGPPKDCSDGNGCTDDLCSAPSGACSNPPNTAPCSDGNACTTGDVCAAGSCRPGTGQLACNDGNACTSDGCSPATGCVFPNAPNGTGCSDGSLCTSGDACVNGSCNGTPVTCPEDGNACTTATCQPAAGCGQAPNTAPCDDSNPCTEGDVCSGGSCVSGPAKDCSDGNDCTNDACDRTDGSCDHANNTASCSDGDPCTPGDACVNGACQPGGPPLDCDTGGNVCQVGRCDAVLGCVFDAAPPGTTCNDGNPCTSNDLCGNGTCSGTAIPGCQPAAVPTSSGWGRILLVVGLGFTMLMASARWQRRRPAA